MAFLARNNPDSRRLSGRGTGQEEVLGGRVHPAPHNPSKRQSLLRSAWLRAEGIEPLLSCF